MYDRINLNAPSVYGVMRGWDNPPDSDLRITRKAGKTLINAVIPAALRLKNGGIPKKINALLSFVSAENKMKLGYMGVSVNYVFEDVTPMEYLEGKEAA